jgi:hypothetical protein
MAKPAHGQRANVGFQVAAHSDELFPVAPIVSLSEHRRRHLIPNTRSDQSYAPPQVAAAESGAEPQSRVLISPDTLHAGWAAATTTVSARLLIG